MSKQNMVLVDKQELEKISINLSASLGEDDPTIFSIPAMSDLEKVIEDSTSYPVVDIVALRGIAEVLDKALNSSGPYTLQKREGTKEWKEEISRKEMLEYHIEDVIKSIYELVGNE